MLILGIDTATLVSSVALVSETKKVAELTIETTKTHSERLMPNIEQLLRMADVNKNELEAVAVSIGPGSFTGLRIGLATAKALSYALKIPLVGVPTLKAQALSVPAPDNLLCPIMDAQKRNVYQAVYTYEGGKIIEKIPARVISIDKLVEELADCNQKIIVMGEAAKMYKRELENINKNILIAPAHVCMPSAACTAQLGLYMLNEGYQEDSLTIEPFYIRRSEAEVLWEKRHGVCS